ncbi:hypothetical protein BDN72DRAFT_830832 [Pluteus cervinus]|uniref:Uncharacterized protein n=1 Tax=Pluteus cervinus TaxID=181527 RepID=A0ACD3BGY1_9AGAR|nr:hypothetical protein BDN72DRAFT_830832 [Pluteus cervinus]
MSSSPPDYKVERSQNAPPPAMPEPDYAPDPNSQGEHQGAPPPAYTGPGPPPRSRRFRPMLPPCEYGYHQPRVEFGLCGILAAIFCFPIGLLCLCLDTDRRCVRCGMLM